jgi:hypothetical protein
MKWMTEIVLTVATELAAEFIFRPFLQRLVLPCLRLS